jgi:Sedlin, N-terminal conserved region
MSNQALLFLIVGKNEPLYEVEIHKRGSTGNSDAVARQSYFVVHSSLDLVETAAWVSQNVRDHSLFVVLTLILSQGLPNSIRSLSLIAVVVSLTIVSDFSNLRIVVPIIIARCISKWSTRCV